MGLTKTVVQWVDRITEGGHLHVKTVTRVFEDGVQLGSDAIHRQAIGPGDPEYETVRAVLLTHLDAAEKAAAVAAASIETTADTIDSGAP